MDSPVVSPEAVAASNLYAKGAVLPVPRRASALAASEGGPGRARNAQPGARGAGAVCGCCYMRPGGWRARVRVRGELAVHTASHRRRFFFARASRWLRTAGNYEAAVEALNSLKSKSPNDVRVQHNMLLAQYLADACVSVTAWLRVWVCVLTGPHTAGATRRS